MSSEKIDVHICEPEDMLKSQLDLIRMIVENACKNNKEFNDANLDIKEKLTHVFPSSQLNIQMGLRHCQSNNVINAFQLLYVPI